PLGSSLVPIPPGGRGLEATEKERPRVERARGARPGSARDHFTHPAGADLGLVGSGARAVMSCDAIAPSRSIGWIVGARPDMTAFVGSQGKDMHHMAKAGAMTGGMAIVEALIANGVDTVFGLPGAQLYPLFDALEQKSERIRTVGARHEQACG